MAEERRQLKISEAEVQEVRCRGFTRSGRSSIFLTDRFCQIFLSSDPKGGTCYHDTSIAHLYCFDRLQLHVISNNLAC